MLAADRDGVCAAQQEAGAGNLDIDGALASAGVATLDVARHVSIYCAGNMSAVTFTLTGTDRYGTVITEDVTGPNATTVTSAKNFKTITQVAVDGAVGTNVEVGSADEAETKWVPVGRYAGKVGINVVLNSTADFTYALQSTGDDLQEAGFQENDATAFVDASITAETTSQAGSVDVPVSGLRLAITAYVAGGLELLLNQRMAA